MLVGAHKGEYSAASCAFAVTVDVVKVDSIVNCDSDAYAGNHGSTNIEPYAENSH